MDLKQLLECVWERVFTRRHSYYIQDETLWYNSLQKKCSGWVCCCDFVFWCVEYAQLNSAIHFLSFLHFPSEPGRVALSFSAQVKCCAIHLLMHRLCNDGCIFISGLYEACSECVTLVFSSPSLFRKGRGGEDGRNLTSGGLWCFTVWEHRLPLEMLMRRMQMVRNRSLNPLREPGNRARK